MYDTLGPAILIQPPQCLSTDAWRADVIVRVRGMRARVKTGSSRSGTDERGKCDSVGLSAACPSNEATIRSVVVAVA